MGLLGLGLDGARLALGLAGWGLLGVGLMGLLGWADGGRLALGWWRRLGALRLGLTRLRFWADGGLTGACFCCVASRWGGACCMVVGMQGRASLAGAGYHVVMPGTTILGSGRY